VRKIGKAIPDVDAIAGEEPPGTGRGAGAGGTLEAAGVPARCRLPPVGEGVNVERDSMAVPLWAS
jgi:hypothetical protein